LTSALVLCLFLNDYGTNMNQIQAIKLDVLEQ